MPPLLVYMTTPSLEEARTLCTYLVEQRLAACANIFPGGESVYRWQGAVEHAQEYFCVLKTEEDRFAELRAAVRRLHSYDTPCVVALPLVDGDADFLAWLRAETRPIL